MSEPLSSRAAAIAHRLAGWPRRRVTLAELWRLFDEADPASRADGRRRGLLEAVLAELERAGQIRSPSRASYDRTERPPLPRFVWLPAREAAAPPAPIVWHPDLSWAADARLAPAQRGALARVNRWLHSHRDPLVVPMRERSVELFGNEKALERLSVTGLFGPDRLSLELLRCRRVTPRFIAEPVGPGELLLVLENSDTFDSLVRVLRDTPGHRVGRVGWGAGAAFEGSVLSVHPSVREVRYFGDLDEKGLQIPINAAATARRVGLPPVLPATGLYHALFRLGSPQPGQRRVQAATAAQLVAWLPTELREPAAGILTTGNRLAQESVGLAYLGRDQAWLGDLR